MKKAIIVMTATVLCCVAQVLLVGVNGLTLYSLPITLFLGIKGAEKLTEQEEKNINN